MQRNLFRHKTLRTGCLALILCAVVSGPVFAQLEVPELRERVDRAIERGLEYLSENQLATGNYPGNHGETAAIPALAGMAFLSVGIVPGEGKYGENVNRIIDYVLSIADERSYLGVKGNGRMYAHSIATLFLSEVSGMVDARRQEKIDAVLPGATRILLDAQAVKKIERHRGGWRYEPHSKDSDMSCSGWALMSLRSARLNGAAVPIEAINSAVEYVKRHHDKDQGSFGYQDGKRNAETLSGAGILCLELCGEHNDPASLRAARYLSQKYKNLVRNHRGIYGVYYTSQGLFQIGGEHWRNFAEWMYETWIPRQHPDGSWNKGEENSVPYQTAMVILAFTVPYRQLPIYQRDETVDED